MLHQFVLRRDLDVGKVSRAGVELQPALRHAGGHPFGVLHGEEWIAIAPGDQHRHSQAGHGYTGASVPAKISQASTVLASRLRMI